jgi:hypothetical protein
MNDTGSKQENSDETASSDARTRGNSGEGKDPGGDQYRTTESSPASGRGVEEKPGERGSQAQPADGNG